MKDSFGRKITYMRVSVTDRCNMRCTYCMPLEGVAFKPRRGLLTDDEFVTIIQAAARLGIEKIRVTGGEPLTRGGVVDLVGRIADIPGIREVAMSTNGMLLGRHAHQLAKVGLRRVNISLDSLRPDRFEEMTRLGNFQAVWDGIEAALDAGLHPVKLNMVVVRGFNDDELEEMAALTLQRPLHVRFIELMPFGEAITWAREKVVPAAEIKARIAQYGELLPAPDVNGNGPARNFRLPGALGSIGFITALSDCFCGACNRIRLTCEGQLRPCLFGETGVDLRADIREQKANVLAITEIIRNVIWNKPENHGLDHRDGLNVMTMSQIGG